MATTIKRLLMKWVYLLLVQLLISSSSLASSIKTPAMSAIGNLRSCFEFYKSEHGNYPKSWSAFVENDEGTKKMFAYFRQIIDTENRYTILSPPLTLRVGNRQLKFIMIANQSGDEGDREALTENGNIEILPGRWYIAEKEDGILETGLYSEKQLALFFTNSGLNLADYTFPTKPAPPSGSLLKRLRSSWNKILQSPEPKIPSEKPAAEATKPYSKEKSWLWLIGLIALFVSLLGYILFKRKQRG